MLNRMPFFYINSAASASTYAWMVVFVVFPNILKKSYIANISSGIYGVMSQGKICLSIEILKFNGVLGIRSAETAKAE